MKRCIVFLLILTSSKAVFAINVRVSQIIDFTKSIGAVIKNNTKADSVASIYSLKNYSGNAHLLVVTDSFRGGTFYKSNASLTADGGIVFKAYDSGFWVRKYKGAVNVLWYGAKPDSTTDNNSAFNHALATKQEVIIPKGNFYIKGVLYVYNNITGLQTPAIRFWQDNGVPNDGLLFKILANNVVIKGLNILGDTVAYIHASLRAIEMTNRNNLTVKNCSFKNSIIRILNDSGNAVMKGFKIINCNINVSFRYLHPQAADQYDVFAIYGCEDVNIINNIIQADSCNRIFKISADRKDDGIFYASKNVIINGNKITGNGNREMLDAYAATQSLSFTNNFVDVSNFSEAIANKSRTNYNWGNFIIKGNYIKNNKQAINIVGGYGLINNLPPVDSLNQNLIISSNVFFKSDTTDNTPFFDLRFNKNIKIDSNTFSVAKKINNYYPVFLGSSYSVIISNNQSDWGGIEFDNVDHALDTQLYKIDYRNILINNNIISNYNTSTGAVYFDVDTSKKAYISILANTLKTSNPTLKAIYFSSKDTVNTVIIRGNTSLKSSNNVYYPTFFGITKLTEKNNSWNTQSIQPIYATSLTDQTLRLQRL